MKITWIGSPNFTQGRQGLKPRGIVIHWMAGKMASADAVFQNRTRNTSAHYGVEDGNVHQYVKETDTAYHASNWEKNLETIGIEHSAEPGRLASNATYQTSIQLVAEICKRWNIDPIKPGSIVPHNSIAPTQCPGTMDLNRIKNGAKELLGGKMSVINEGDLTFLSLLSGVPVKHLKNFAIVGKDWKTGVTEMYFHKFYKANGYPAQIAKLKSGIGDLNTKVDQITQTNAGLQGKIAELTKTVETLQLASSEDTVQLNAVGNALRWLIKRLGLKEA